MNLPQIKLDLWLISVTTLSILQTAESQTLTPRNVALGRGQQTPGSTGDDVRYGSRAAVVDGNRTASLNYTHCTGCFATQKNSYGWWGVNLGQPFFVTSVHIYVPRNPLNGAAILKEAATKTIVSNSGSMIADIKVQRYSKYQKIGYTRPSGSSTLTIQAVSPVRYAQYVALVNPAGGTSPGIRLAEVEVYGFDASQFVPRDLRVSSVNVSSVSLSWGPPSDQTLSITYEYGCGEGAISWTELTTAHPNITRQVGNLTPNTRYNCRVRVKDNPTTTTQAIVVTTDCATPPTAVSLSFGSPAREYDDGRERWRYNATWTVSSGYNQSCLHSTNPYKLTVDGVDIENYHNNGYTYHADGNSQASISMWTRNKHGVLSVNPLVESITTAQGLPPQLAPLNLVLTSPSYECVQLAWDPPQYPNTGAQTTVTHQYKCDSMGSWQTVPSNNRSCIYSAYQEVACQLRVRNRYNNVDRDSDVATSDSIRTRCTAPSPPRNITLTPLGVVYHEAKGRDQTQYRVSWDEPSEANCASLRLNNRYRVYYIGSQGRPTNNRLNYTIHADGDTEIEVRVRAYNNENKHSTVTKIITTEPLRPQLHPESYTLESFSADCVTLSWAPPTYPNGPITGYQYNCTDNNTWVRAGGSVAQNATRCNYLPYAEVTCQIRAENSEGFSDVDTKTMRTQCADPELPDNLTSYIVDEIVGKGDQARRQITLNLSKSIIKPNCAEIPEDGIKFGVIGGQQVATNDSIADLNATTEYQIIVVVNNDQDFTANTTINYTTGELAPYTSPKMEIYFNSSCAFLVLSPPDEPNGILTHYQFGCDYYDDYLHNSSSATSMNVTIHSQKLEETSKVCGFISASRLTCWAVAVNSIGQSPASEEDGNTEPRVKYPMSKVIEKREYTDRVELTLYPIELDGNRTSVRSYIVVVRKVDVLDTRKKRYVQQECQHRDELYNSAEAAKRNQSCYITASYDVSDIVEGGIKMVVGDDSNKGGYQNTRLEQNETYEIYLAITGVYIEGGGEFTLYVKSVLREPPTNTATTTEETSKTTKPGAMVAGIVIPLILIFSLIGAFFFYRRHNMAESKRKDNLLLNYLGDTDAETRSNGTGITAEQPNVEDIYVIIRSVSIDELLDHVEQNESGVKQDYQELQNQPKPVMSKGLLPENKGKSKYKGLYPADSHRVVLQRASGSEETDFINASYIAGVSGENEYIASQGPQPATLSDFWLMIWQQEVRAVVMVTSVIENDKLKCVRYWPVDCDRTMTCDDISINMTSCVEYADFVLRDLKVTKDGKMKHVKQFHFTSWPDHGVPNEISSFITFYRKVKAETCHMSGPLLVHCSAGVGRTGTFLAMDMALTKAKSGDLDVDLYECVSEMRRRRPCMVQTEIQYLFLHKVIYEAYTTEGFVTPCNELDNRLNSEQIYANDSDPISVEFRHLQRMISIHPLDVSEGKSAENRSKNRDPEILPPSKPPKDRDEKWLRPELPDDAYINAVMLDGYRKQSHLIATQLPLEDTRSDFWQMIDCLKVKVILQLDEAKSGEEFYPDTDGGEKSYGGYTVKRKSALQDDQLSTINLQIISDSQEQDVFVLYASNWTSDSVPQVETIKHYFDCLERFQQQTGDGKICIMSRDGAMKCGLIISAYNAVEKMKVEQEVDVYNSAVMARYRRPQFINTVTEYNFLYNVLKHYADQYTDYANFQ